MSSNASQTDRDGTEVAKAEQLGVRLGWVSLYGLAAAGLVGLLGACLGLTAGEANPSVGGALYLVAGVVSFRLLLKVLGRP